MASAPGPLTLPVIASKVRGYVREADVNIKPPLVQVRQGWYTGADVRISSNASTKVEVVSKIPIEERAGKIVKMSGGVGAVLCFAVALLITIGMQQELNEADLDLAARRQGTANNASAILLISAPFAGTVFGGIAGAIAVALLGGSPQAKEKNRKWAKDLENHLNATL